MHSIKQHFNTKNHDKNNPVKGKQDRPRHLIISLCLLGFYANWKIW